MSENGSEQYAMDCVRCGKTIPFVEWRDACLECLSFGEYVELKQSVNSGGDG